MNVPCPVHGSRRAHRSCHFCRLPICRLCELVMRGHLYCSPRCARDDARAAVWNRLRRWGARPVPSRLAVGAVAAVLAAPGLLAVRAVSELDRLSSGSPAATRRPPVARIESVESRADGVRIQGSAPAGSAVFLFAGGALRAAAPAENGRFVFERVSVAGPYRVGALALAGETSRAAPPASLAPPPAAQSAAAIERTQDQKPPPSGARVSAVPDFTRGPADRREIVLSFDAGSSGRGALEILDTLRRRGVRTTIFLTGEFIRRHPDLARRVAADGHEVGNHTDSHPHLTTYASDGRQATRPRVDRALLARELDGMARAYREATGREVAPIWRAPYGEQNAEIRRWAAERGYWHVGWTGGEAGLDGLDWVSDPRSRAYRSSGRVVQRLLARAENGGIVLLHLGSDREDPVAPRVPELLDGLARRGFTLVRATELLDRVGLTAERLAGRNAGSPPWRR